MRVPALIVVIVVAQLGAANTAKKKAAGKKKAAPAVDATVDAMGSAIDAGSTGAGSTGAGSTDADRAKKVFSAYDADEDGYLRLDELELWNEDNNDDRATANGKREDVSAQLVMTAMDVGPMDSRVSQAEFAAFVGRMMAKSAQRRAG